MLKIGRTHTETTETLKNVKMYSVPLIRDNKIFLTSSSVQY